MNLFALVSIIVPMYNDEAYIKRCLDSIRSQTFQQFECIIIDDGSTDRSADIASQFLSDERFSLIAQANSGPAKARKAGSEASTCDYLIFVDGDDWLAPEMIETLYDKIIHTNADIVSCGYYIDSARNMQSTVKNGLSGVFSPEEAVLHLHNNHSVYGSVWNKIFKKKVIVPQCFPTEHFAGQDYYMVIQALMVSDTIIHISDPLYHYMQNSDGISKIGYGKDYTKAFFWLNSIMNQLVKIYPNIADSIVNYHLSIEFMTLNSMIRNNSYDPEMQNTILSFINDNYKIYLKNKQNSFYYRLSIYLVARHWNMYKVIYRNLLGSRLYFYFANDY